MFCKQKKKTESIHENSKKYETYKINQIKKCENLLFLKSTIDILSCAVWR